MWTAAILLALAGADAMPQSPTFESRRWQDRLLVVFAPTADAPALLRQRALLRPAGDGIADRDMALIEIVGDSVSGVADDAAALRRRFGVAPGETRILLIGKDGGTKLSDARPISPERLFATIDAMPMRRAEMRRATR